MIADFYKAIKKPETERVLPAKVVKELNKQLPRGYEYVSDGNGHYIIKPSSKKKKQHFAGIVNYEKSGIPKEITQEQIGDYAYRTQKRIFFDNVSIVEGKKTISISDTYVDPITKEKTEIANDFMMFPAPFPPAVPMVFETYDGEKVNIEFKRVPYESMTHIKFENVTFPALKMSWILPEREHKTELGPGVINISVTPTKAETVEDAVMALKIIKSFAQKKLKINDTTIGEDLGGNAAKLDNDELEERLLFWNAFRQLENIIGVKFFPGADYPEEDQHFAGELFYNFLDNKDFVYVRPFTQFHVGIGSLTQKDDTLNEIVGKPGLSLSFVGEAKATLMGAEFELFQTNVLVDMTLDRIVLDEDKKGAELFVSDAPNSEFKMIKRYFLSREEAQNGMDRIYKEYSTYKMNERDEENSSTQESLAEELEKLLSVET